MHSRKFDDETVINYNGDYSGNVKIVVAIDKTMTFASLGRQFVEVNLSFEVLRSLVFDYMRQKAISNLESMTDDDFEEYLSTGWDSDKLEPGKRQVMAWQHG